MLSVSGCLNSRIQQAKGVGWGKDVVLPLTGTRGPENDRATIEDQSLSGTATYFEISDIWWYSWVPRVPQAAGLDPNIDTKLTSLSCNSHSTFTISKF
jgi:hypothetical protein